MVQQKETSIGNHPSRSFSFKIEFHKSVDFFPFPIKLLQICIYERNASWMRMQRILAVFFFVIIYLDNLHKI